ncbi:MAG: hypothetical protein H6737_14055 [Alphaproteobacteria bacterium]|nr:hypothetical protein [Alphaproteobacteria bacterium]
MERSDLERRALRAYERGRLRRALPWGLWAVGFTVAAAAVGAPFALPLGTLLAAWLVGFQWRGGELARGVVPGLAAGSIAFLAPVAWACQSGACTSACTTTCTAMAVASGGVGGLLLWNRVGSTSAVSALLVAATAGAMGCLALGTSGLVGVAAVVVAGAPAVLRRPAVA